MFFSSFNTLFRFRLFLGAVDIGLFMTSLSHSFREGVLALGESIDVCGFSSFGSFLFDSAGSCLKPVSYTHLTLPTKA